MKQKDVKIFMGSKIKEYREKIGLKQEQVAQVLDLSRISIMNIESGRHGTTVYTIMQLCGLFKCTPNDLYPPIKNIRFTIEEKSVMVRKKVKTLKIVK